MIPGSCLGRLALLSFVPRVHVDAEDFLVDGGKVGTGTHFPPMCPFRTRTLGT